MCVKFQLSVSESSRDIRGIVLLAGSVIIPLIIRSSRCGRVIFVQADFVDFVLILCDMGCFSYITKPERLLQIELIQLVCLLSICISSF